MSIDFLELFVILVVVYYSELDFTNRGDKVLENRVV